MMFDFSETAEWTLTNLDRKQELAILYQVCVFLTDRETKMVARPLIGWDIFDFSETAERNETKLYRKQELSVLYQPNLCFSDWVENQDGRPGLRFAETFSTLPLKPLDGICRNLTEARTQCPLPSSCFFLAGLKTTMAALSSNRVSHSGFSSETAERNLRKLDRKQELSSFVNILSAATGREAENVRNSHSIRGQSGRHSWRNGPKDIDPIKGVEYLLPPKCRLTGRVVICIWTWYLNHLCGIYNSH